MQTEGGERRNSEVQHPKQMPIKKTTQLISKIGLLVVALPPRAWIHDQASERLDGWSHDRPSKRSPPRLPHDAGITLFDLDDPRQGIVHIVSPEQGIAYPGLSLVCPDSHTCTQGALGAMAWGIRFAAESVLALSSQKPPGLDFGSL